MIDLYTNPDELIALSDATPTPHDGIPAKTIRMAAHDIKNLRDYVWQLEKNAAAAANESKSIASALLAAVSPDLDRRIDEHVKTAFDKNQRLDAFEARLETVEHVTADLDADSIDGLEQMIDDRIEEASCGNDRDDETRDTVRDMIRDGEIIVTVDLS